MANIKNVVIVGLGAIGSIYAVKLSQFDPQCVTVLVDEGRKQRYQREGILFNGERFDFNYLTPQDVKQPADLILIATKSQGLSEAIEAIAPLVHEDTVIISLLNGISGPTALAERYGWEHVLYAFFTGHGSTRVGNAVTFDGVGTIVFGEADNSHYSDKLQRVVDLFDQAHIDYDIPQDMLLAMWKKFVLNVGVNQASAVLHASYGDFQRNPQALEVATMLMQEAIHVAEAVGINQTETLLPWCLDFIQNMPSDFKSSMLQDIEAGRQTEIDLFAGTVCELGDAHQVDTPYNRLFLKLIRALESAD